MSRSVAHVLLAFAILGSAFHTGLARSLSQTAELSQKAAAPPGASFGGPLNQPASNVLTPAGTVTKINWRGVGTQNYSSGSDSKYASSGAVADFFLQTGGGVVGKHFFLNTGSGLSPVFTRQDATTGQELGRVVGQLVASDATPDTNDNGGYGSVPTLLLQATSATGFFQGVTFITRTNVTGGTVPGNPPLFTLPASPQGVPNFQLAVPYQADYKFWVQGSSATGR